ncbi:MAG: hypothetical protein ACE10H_15110 [Candidatus Binatia bacterium]
MSENRRKRQDALKAVNGSLYTEVSRLVWEADPIRLIAIGAPDDDYDPEVSTLFPRLREAKSPDDVQWIVHEEFVHWFGAETAGPATHYTGVSEDIWEAWNKFRPNARFNASPDRQQRPR